MIGRFLLGMAAGAAAATLYRRRTPVEPPRTAVPDKLDPDRRRLVGIIAHELRSPVSVIIGYQELLSEGLLGPVNGRAGDALERIRRAASQLHELTDGLEILTGEREARRDAGAEIVDLADIVANVVHDCTGDARARGLQVQSAADGPAPVRASADALGRLLDLLITASIRTADSEPIAVHVTTSDSTATASTRGARFDADTDGPALSARPDSVSTAVGLRLAIAQRLARSAGGAVRLDAGQFVLELPLSPDR